MTTRNLCRSVVGCACGALLFLGACSEPAGLGGTERMGVIQWHASQGEVSDDPTWPGADDVVIEAPSTAQAGEPFEAVVWTVGNSGCWEVARTEVENGAALAEIRPVDRDRMTEGLACTAVLVELRHPVQIVFTEPGEAIIRVVGRLIVGEDFSQGEEFVVERAVTVTS